MSTVGLGEGALVLTTPTWLTGQPIHFADRLITGPSLEPIDIDELKKYLRFTPTTEDTVIDTLISAARQYFEDMTGVICLTQIWEMSMSGAPGDYEIELTKSPLQSVVAVNYDVSGVETPMSVSDYSVLPGMTGSGGPGRIRLADGASWPSFSTSVSGGLRIRYAAGFGDAPGDVPEIVKWAIAMLTATMHKFRGDVHEQTAGLVMKVPFSSEQIITEYKRKNLRTLIPRFSRSWA